MSRQARFEKLGTTQQEGEKRDEGRDSKYIKWYNSKPETRKTGALTAANEDIEF